MMNLIKQLKNLTAELTEEEEDLQAFQEELRGYSPLINEMQESVNKIQTALDIAKEDITRWDTQKGTGPMVQTVRGVVELERTLSRLTEFIWGYPFQKVRYY